ncbi:MAG: hypothetical protein LBC88_07535 [Spirochaetaceae bacterium]|nr:hypothetical protein [Spirochaetaceae bacterium]
MNEALNARAAWLEREALPKLKEEFRAFHNAFYSIYSLILKKKLIKEDPYKSEAKVADIKVPNTASFTEAERPEQLGLRLAEFDNQLDFLVNFYQFSLDNMGLEKIKRILGLIKYIDWVHFSPDAASTSNTNGMIETITQAKNQSDQLSVTIIGDALSVLEKSSPVIFNYLRDINDYNREAYKAELRAASADLKEADANPAGMKKKYAQAHPGKIFYAELAAEVAKEDYTKEGAAQREKILQKLLAALDGGKPKQAKAPVSFKSFLIEGLFAIGSVSATFTDILPKLDENAEILANRRKGFWEKLRTIVAQVMNREPESAVYDIEYVDAARGVTVKDKVVFNTFRSNLDQRIKTLFNVSTRGLAVSKLEGMEEAKLQDILERYIRDVQNQHKILSALDDYFKAAADSADRDKIKGIKPELSTIKNAIVKANQKRYDYIAQKEEAAQFKRMGIETET